MANFSTLSLSKRCPNSIVEFFFVSTLGYFSIASISVFFAAGKKFHVYDSYSTLCLTILFLGALYVLIKYRNTVNSSQKTLDLLDFLGIFLIGTLFFALHFDEILNVPFWLDEYTQFIYSGNNHFGGPAQFAALQQQPPLDYFLSAFSYHFYGLSIVSARAHALASSFLFVLIHFLTVRGLTGKVWIALLNSILAISTPLLQFYSVEARPLSLSLLFGQFVIYFYIQFIKNNGNIKYFFLSLISQSIFVLTTGLQPEIFLIVVCLSISPFLLHSKTIFLVFKYWLASFLTAIFFIPFFVFIFQKSSEQSQFHASWISEFIKSLPQRGFNDYITIYKPLEVQGLALLILAFFTFLIMSKNSGKQLLSTRTLNISTLLCLILFPPFFFLIYDTFINWKFDSRYFICFFSIPLITLAQFTDFIHRHGGNFFKKWTPLFLFFLTAFVFPKNLQPQYDQDYLYDRNLRADWKSTYHFLNNNLRDKDSVYHFSYHRYQEWRPSIYVNIEFFVPKEKRKHFKSNFLISGLHHTFSTLGEDIGLQEVNGKVFLLFTNYSPNPDTTESFKRLQKNTDKVHQFTNVTLFQFKDHNNVLNFLNFAKSQLPKNPNLSMVYETLISYHLSRGENNTAKKLLGEFADLQFNNGPKTLGDTHDVQKVLDETIAFYSNWLSQGKRTTGITAQVTE